MRDASFSDINETLVDVRLEGPSGQIPTNMALLLYAAAGMTGGASFRASAVAPDGSEIASMVLWPTEALFEGTGDIESALCRDDFSFRLFQRRRFVDRAVRRHPLGWVLWRAGRVRDDALLPWLNAKPEATFSVSSWPEIPPEERTPDVARCLARLCRSSLGLSELCSVLGTPRARVVSLLNAVAMQRRLVVGKTVVNPFSALDFEQTLFVGALLSRLSDVHSHISSKRTDRA